MSAASADMVYVSNEKDDTISVIDTATFSVVKTFPVG
jgi:YVTN family beta-propeller protein